MAVLPTRELSIEFDAGVWTDVWADVVDVSTRRGRNRELGAYETGQLVVTLRNDSRQYDPDNAAGTYYGKLRPNRRVRFRAVWDSDTHPVFVGYIDRIEQVYGGPNDATCVITVSDRFKILNRVELPRSVYTAVVAASEPLIWYRFDETDGSTIAMNSGTLGHDYDGLIRTDFPEVLEAAGPRFGEQSLVVRDGGTSYGTDEDHIIEITVPDFSVGNEPFAVEAWVRLQATPLAGGFTTLFFQQGIGTSGTGVGLAITDDARPRMVVYNDAGTAYAVRSSSALTIGEKYHVVGRHDSDGSLHVFVDGVDVSVADLGVGGTTSGTFTRGGVPVYLPRWWGNEIVIDELAFYRTLSGEALTDADIALHNSAGRTPWTGDSPGLRLSRILALAGVPILEYDLDTGAPTLQAASLGGSALAYAQKIEETTLGAFFVAKDGTLVFIGRDELVTGDYLVSQATIADHMTGPIPALPYRSSSADVDEADLITRATVSREGSAATTYADQAAIDEFQAVDATYEGLLHDDDAYSQSYAEWIVNTHKDPRSRLGTVVLDLPHTPDDMYPGILALELADQVTYVRQPQNVGDPIIEEMRVEAIAHETGGHYWRTSLQLSSFHPGEGGYPVWVWGETNWGEHVWGMG